MLPATATTALSVNTCRTSRPRLPPTAVRMANSRWRAAPCDSISPATLTHAMRSTSVTAVAMIDSAGRRPASCRRPAGRACTTGAPPLPKKKSVSRWLGAARAAAVPSASTCASVTPAFTRASAVNTNGPAGEGASGMTYGIQHRTSGSGNPNPGGITPTMVCGVPSSDSVRPTTSRRAAKRSRHSPSLMSTTGAPPSRASSCASNRPRAGATPRVPSTRGEIRAPGSLTFSASNRAVNSASP